MVVTKLLISCNIVEYFYIGDTGTWFLLIFPLDNLFMLFARGLNSVLRRPSSFLWRTLSHKQVRLFYCRFQRATQKGIFAFYSLTISCQWQLLWCLQSMRRTKMKMVFSIWPTVGRTHLVHSEANKQQNEGSPCVNSLPKNKKTKTKKCLFSCLSCISDIYLVLMTSVN